MEMRDLFTEIVNEANRALIVNNLGPVRPLIEFPVSTSGKRTFKFQSRWYDLHSWLEYSVLEYSAFTVGASPASGHLVSALIYKLAIFTTFKHLGI